MKIGRNDPCPCGSGKKFKHCHMGREDELTLMGMDEITDEISAKITSLPDVEYGRSKEILDSLDIPELTGNKIGVRCIDLKRYSDLNIYGAGQSKNLNEKGGGIFINIYKTLMTDPNNIGRGQRIPRQSLQDRARARETHPNQDRDQRTRQAQRHDNKACAAASITQQGLKHR